MVDGKTLLYYIVNELFSRHMQGSISNLLNCNCTDVFSLLISFYHNLERLALELRCMFEIVRNSNLLKASFSLHAG